MRKLSIITIWLFVPVIVQAQLQDIRWLQPTRLQAISHGSQTYPLTGLNMPLWSARINGKPMDLSLLRKEGDTWLDPSGLSIRFINGQSNEKGLTQDLHFENVGKDTLLLDNFVPFGEHPDKVYITGLGDHWLSRTHLFRPGLAPVNVIVPDNAWELGFSFQPIPNSEQSLVGLSRRISWDQGAQRRRFETLLPPGGRVIYRIYADIAKGDWQEGLRMMFQQRWLYDLEQFDQTLFERADLKWIRNKYIIHLIMAWDKDFYDYKTGQFGLEPFLQRAKKLYGGNDVIGLWPTWPALGLDPRNQWDMFRDLPGGTAKLSELADMTRKQGSAFFISYNPWDESTRIEDHLSGMADLIRITGADGVVLDTRGASSKELQEAADGVKPGVIMFSEGMAVPRDMPGIVSGRVHNALYYPPLLNLNKFIKPDFAIFRVAEITYERIRREYAISLFNGHGVEINQFRPGKPDGYLDDYRYLGQIARILRQNSAHFSVYNYTPLIPTLQDKIYVNHWPIGDYELYTAFSLIPEGFHDALFELPNLAGRRVVDLYHYEEPELIEREGKMYVKVKTDAFHTSWLGTNNEGAVTAIKVMPKQLEAQLEGYQLMVKTAGGSGTYCIWAGNPDYEKTPFTAKADQPLQLDVLAQFGAWEGKLVVELLNEEEELLDLLVISMGSGHPRLISKLERTVVAKSAPAGMVAVKGGEFKKHTTHGDDFVLYPSKDTLKVHVLKDFFIDKHPVTNAQFKTFMDATKYKPQDPTNFLKHWVNGQIPQGEDLYPVVYVSKEDAEAYARWARKRLPTELEWQYAAQFGDGRIWPWGTEFDSTMTNSGDGKAYSIGKFPQAANELGLEDLVGNVWQLTADEYESGSYRFVILKGGSYFKPLSSWWYVQGGPKDLTWQQMLLRVSASFERNATVGFRCVVDAVE